jgi:hypothetical protein
MFSAVPLPLMLRQAQHEDFFYFLTLSLSKGEEIWTALGRSEP